MEKKTLLALGAAALTFGSAVNATAQTWTPAGSSMYPNPLSTTRIGIGIIPPPTNSDMLTVRGEIGFNPWANSYSNIYGRSPARGLALFGDNNELTGSNILLNTFGTGTPNAASIQFVSPGTASNLLAHQFISVQPDPSAPNDPSKAQWLSRLSIRKDGNIGINMWNIANMSDKLTVNGNIGFETNITDASYRSITARSNKAGLSLVANNGLDDGGVIYMNSTNTDPGADKGTITYVSSGVGANQTEGWEPAHSFITWNKNGSTNADKWLRRMVINKNGDVTIGNNIPALGRLTVGGRLMLFDHIPTTYRALDAGAGASGLAIYSNDKWSEGAGILLNGNGTGNVQAGTVTLVSSGNNIGTYNPSHIFATWDNSIPQANGGPTWRYRMVIDGNGRVVIGSVAAPNNDNYKLIVQTGILTEKIKVATVNGGNWSDFVFADDYKLRDLKEVEQFIKENKHLPEIPSAKEVEKDGLDLVQMDAKLLQKVEELTLYMIELKKQNERQNREIAELKQQLQSNKN